MRELGVGAVCVLALAAVLSLVFKKSDTSVRETSHAMEVSQLRAEAAAARAETTAAKADLAKAKAEIDRLTKLNAELARKSGGPEKKAAATPN